MVKEFKFPDFSKEKQPDGVLEKEDDLEREKSRREQEKEMNEARREAFIEEHILHASELSPDQRACAIDFVRKTNGEWIFYDGENVWVSGMRIEDQSLIVTFYFDDEDVQYRHEVERKIQIVWIS